MADEERGTDGPSLELPSLSFGRKRRKKAAQAAPEPPAAAAPPEPEPEPASRRTRPPAPELPEPTPPPLFADEVVAPPAEPQPEPGAADPAPGPVAPATPVASKPPVASTPARSAPKRPAKQPRSRRQLRLPALGGPLAAVVTGILVGVIAVGLTWASLRGCDAVRGTSSCGGPGYLLLLGIMIAMILLGAALLRAWGVPDPGSTSTLAVGLLAVLAMLFLVGVLFHWWMILVIPACSALTFAAAHWVASTFVTDA
jgi:hypothetical protein